MSQISLRIDSYFGSAAAATGVHEALATSHREMSEATLQALSELGFEDSRVVADWFNVFFERRSRKITLSFDAPASSDEDWEAPLIGFLTRQGATHVLVDQFHDPTGTRAEYGYIDGKRTTLKRMMKALQAVDPSVALAEAVRRKRTGEVKKLLAEGADPNGGGKVPAVVGAVDAESPRVLELLLKAGAEVNRPIGETGATALHRCAALGEHERRDRLAKILLEHGADPNLPDGDGWSPLQLAADHGSPRLAAPLLEDGGDPDARLDDGRTVAMIAAGASNDGLGVLRALEAHGADLAAVDPEGRDAFFYAQPRVELEEYLLARNLERYVPQGEYVGDAVADLFTAIRFDHREKVDELVTDETLADARTRYSPHAPQEIFVTALYRATAMGRREIVELLLARGADPDVLCGRHTSSTALRKAAADGDIRIVQALIDAGADLEATRDPSDTPLLAAVSGKHVEIVRLLLDAGADPRAEHRGANALQRASGASDEARALYELLADRVPLDDEKRYRILENALHQENRWLVLRLAQEGLAIRPRDLAQAVARDDLETFELLLPFFQKARASPAAKEAPPATPPLVACCRRLVKSGARGPVRRVQLRIFETLLEVGVDVDEPATTHETALIVLQQKKGFVAETRKLCAAGADPNRLVPSYLGGDYDGEFSALHVAAYKGLVENTAALIEAGAEVDVEEGEGKFGTALQIARARGKKKVVTLLLEHGADDPPPRVVVRDLSLAEAKRRFLEVIGSSPFVRAKPSRTGSPPVEGLAPELAWLFSRYDLLIVAAGPLETDSERLGLDRAVVAPIEGRNGFVMLGGRGPDDCLLTELGEETVYRVFVDEYSHRSFYHWALSRIAYAELTADL